MGWLTGFSSSAVAGTESVGFAPSNSRTGKSYGMLASLQGYSWNLRFTPTLKESSHSSPVQAALKGLVRQLAVRWRCKEQIFYSRHGRPMIENSRTELM